MEPYGQCGPGVQRCGRERDIHVLRGGRPDRFDSADHGVDQGAKHDGLLSAGAPARRDDEFERLVRSVSADLYGYVVRRFGREGAEDVLQDTFAALYARWNDAPTTAEEQRRWAFGFADHTLANAIRARSRALRLVDAVGARPASVPSVGDDVANFERALWLLDKLQEPARETVRLTVLVGLSAAQAGQRLGCSEIAVRTRVSRACARLRPLLAAEDREEAERVV